jgi:acylphosphatase
VKYVQRSQSEGRARLRAIVLGRVQGVGFRYFTQREACALELSGYVRNAWDGSVEIVAEGDRPRLERLLLLMHQGPRSADVEAVMADWLIATGEFRSFDVRF